jgi:putative membrane-bound dehydrogenase-like protein
MSHPPLPSPIFIRAILAAAVLAVAAQLGGGFASSAAAAEPRPLRVLFFDPTGAEQGKAGVLRIAMEQLGRDAIYFDYFTPSSGLSEKTAGLYDVAMVLGGGDAPALAALKAKQRVVAVKDGDAPAAIRATILATVDPAAKAEWEKFLAQREPEVREKNPFVANYEKRPKPITLQQPFSVKGAMERTQVPADLKLELYASDPEIGKPIAFAWDARGRLWVAATSDYPHGVTEDGVGHDKIVICEDTKGAGRADKFTVFADKLNLPTGLVFARGGMIVAQPPKLLFLKDTDGDDKADVREVLIDGWGIRDTHAQASNLHLGYDNWLYGCVGYSGFKGTVGGKPFDFTQGTYRFKPDGSALEFLHQFTNNAWGQSANDAGDQFGGTANGAPIFFGGIPKSVVPAGVSVMTAKKINVVEQVRAITPNYRQVDVFGTDEWGTHWGGYTAAAGSAFIYSPKLPARFQGKAMVCEPTMKVVELLDVQPDGAGWKALDAMPVFASSDEWTSPVYAEVGPDGAVWIADWQNFIIQHNPTPSVERGGYKATTGAGGAHENALRDHNRGRIYRIVAKDTPAVMPKPLTGAPTAELVAALNSDTQYWRLLAQQLIVDGKKSDAAAALKQIVLANDGAIGAIHALWALQGLGALDEATHKAALLAKDARLRRNAVRALGNDVAAQHLFFGSGVVSDPDLHTRLAAFVKLAEFPTTPEIKTLIGKLAGDPIVKRDEWLAEAAKLLGKKHNANAFKEGPNLLVNGDLEKLGADGLPDGWKRRDYGGEKAKGNKGAEWKIVSGEGRVHGGKNALLCVTRDDGDTSFFQEVAIKPHTMYRLAGWVKTHGFKGKAGFNDHIGRAGTEQVKARESGWVEVEATFDSKDRTKATINILHVAKGDATFDDVRLCELIPIESEEKLLAGDAGRGQKIFWEHPVAACKNCHMLGGVGSTVGPALDGIAARQNAAYIRDSLIEPNKVLAPGFEKLGISPMPPMALILKPQEIADIEAFLQTLKQPK